MADQYISKNGWARKLFDLGLARPAWAEVVAAVNFVGGAAVSNSNPLPIANASVTSAAVITPGTPVTAGRKVLVNCTAAGNIRFKFANAQTIDVAFNIGESELTDYAIVDIVAGSTTATAVVTVLS